MMAAAAGDPDEFGRLTRLIRGEEAEPKELSEGLIGHPLETWARLEAARLGVDLGLMLPMALVMVSALSHGAVRIKVPGLTTTNTVQFIGVAESGIGKTTVQRAGKSVMDPGLEAGEDAMATWVAAQVAVGAGGPPVGQTWTATQWTDLYRAGLCQGGTLIGSATPEAIRNGLAENGSHQVIWTAESDILEEIGGKYGNGRDAGSVTMLLHGWDGEDVAVRRVRDGVIRADGASLPMALLLQPEVFEEVTGAGVFTTKGVLHRTLIAASGPLGLGWADGAVDIGEEGLKALSSPLEKSRVDFAGVLRRLSAATAVHRASRAVLASWRAQGGPLTNIPRPAIEPGRVMVLADDAAVQAFWRVQKARRAVRRAAAAAGAPGGGVGGSLWEPLAARLTDHVLRIACNYRLGMDPDATAIEAEDLDDALDRVLPWLWEHWAVVMARRDAAAVDTAVAKSIKENPKDLDLSVSGLVIRAMGKLTRKQGAALTGVKGADKPGPSFTMSEVKKMAQSLVRPKSARGPAYSQIVSVLAQMVAEGDLVEIAPGEGYKGRERVRLTVSGMGQAAIETR